MGKRKKVRQKLLMNIGGGARRLVDATRDLVIEVKASDVRNSKRMAIVKGGKDKPVEQATCCAAAVAILREEHVKNVRVHRSRVYIEYADRVERYITPPSLRLDLVAFDLYGQFATGEHILLKVPDSQKLGYYRGTSVSTTRTRKKRRPQHALFGVRGKATNPHIQYG